MLSTLGNYEVLRRVLDGYDGQEVEPGAFELVVVVDQVDEEPERVDAMITDRPYPVRRITGRRPGLSANRNTGWRDARAPVVLFTDNDTIPVPTLVAEHLEWHRRFSEEEAAIAGHVRWATELRETPFMKWLDHGIQFNYPAIRGIEANYGVLYGANSSMKRDFIERVGDWDEVNLPYGYEDLDWGYRASKRGLRVLYNRDAIVDHLRYDADLEAWKPKMRRIAFSERQFTVKHPELQPWFHTVFTTAMAEAPASGRGRTLTGLLGDRFGFLSRRAWFSTDLYFRQQLAPYFLRAWAEFSERYGDQLAPGPDCPAA